MAFSKSSVSFYSKMKRKASEQALLEIVEAFAGNMMDRIVAESVLIGFRDNTLHLFKEFCPSLGERLSLEDLRWYRRILALRSKSDDLDLGIDKEAVAWNSYCESELRCAATNRRLREYSTWEKKLPGAFDILHIAKRKISSILGEAPSLADLHCKFGPGANVSCRKKTSARHKLSSSLGCSVEGMKRISELRSLYPRLFEGRDPVLESGEVSMVPKNARTFRTIEFQPLLNTFVQLGIGAAMKRKLVRGGINLYDQAINRRKARLASLPDSGIATIDWSSASDSVSVWLVWLLFDEQWFDLLSDWRCSHVHYRDLSFSTDKFSAMGNGYTFELESIIFYALAFAVCVSEGVSVSHLSIYGDDLICEASVKDRLLEVFSFFGFKVNSEKSYFEGFFRESCGGDYFNGVDIRPVYIKGRLTPARLCRLHNDLIRGFNNDAARTVLRFIPRHLRLYGPDGFGDGHLLGDHPRTLDLKKRSRGFSGYTFKTWVKRSREDKGEVSGDHLLPSYLEYLREKAQDGSERGTDPYVLRGGESPRKISVYVLG